MTRTLLSGALLASSVVSGLAWAQDCSDWHLRTTDGPGIRGWHTMAYDSARGTTVMFGGHNGDTVLSGDTWEWDGTTWTLLGQVGPSPRFDHAMAYDSVRNVVVLFGGADGSPLGDTWEWGSTSWTLRSQAGPAPRYQPAMVYDEARGVTVLFGGGGRPHAPWVYGDTWEWDGTSWTLRSEDGPAPRQGHAMAYDPVRERTVLFGGYAGSYFCSDTWEWDGDTWTQRASSGPPGRHQHGMAYDALLGVTLMCFGSDSNYLDDVWCWDGLDWSEFMGGPPARMSHGIAYDSLRNVVIVFGGATSAPVYSDTWELATSAGPILLQQPESQTVTVGESVSFTVAVDGIGAVTYRWHRNDTPLSDDGRVSGATTATLTVNPVRPDDAGTYSVVTADDCGSSTSAGALLGVLYACGDLNCDGEVNLFDIDPFVVALTVPSQYAQLYPDCDLTLADVNGDGWIDLFDVGPFVALLTGG